MIICKACKGEGWIIKNRFFGLWPTMSMCKCCYGMGYMRGENSYE